MYFLHRRTINPRNRRKRFEPLSITYPALLKAKGNLGKWQELSVLTGTQKFTLHDYADCKGQNVHPVSPSIC